MSFAAHYRPPRRWPRAWSRRAIEHGDRVAIAMRNLPEWVVAFWSAIAAGGVAVPLNAWWTGDELAYGVADSGASVVFCDVERLARLAPHLSGAHPPHLVVVVDEHRGATGLEVVADEGGRVHLRDRELGDVVIETRASVRRFDELQGDVPADAAVPEVDVDPDDDATIFYTSGTTGRPKGAVGTHRNACTNLMNLFFIGQRAQLRFAEPDATPSDVAELVLALRPALPRDGLPREHGREHGRRRQARDDAPLRRRARPRADRARADHGLRRRADDGAADPGRPRPSRRRDTSSVRSVSYGGAPAPPELVRRIKAAFPDGQPGNGYGLTETSAATSMNTGADYVARPDSVGIAVPVTDVAVVPEDYAGPRARRRLSRRARGDRRAVGPRPPGGARLLEPARGDGARLHQGLVAHRGRRAHRRRGLHLHRGPREGRHHPRRRERLLRRGRGRPLRAPRRRGLRGDRRAPRDARRGGRAPSSSRGTAGRSTRTSCAATWPSASPATTCRRGSGSATGHLPRNPAGKVLKRQLRDELVGT